MLARLRISGGGAKSHEHSLEPFQADIPKATTTQKTKSSPILPQSKTSMSPGVQTAGDDPDGSVAWTTGQFCTLIPQ